MSTPLKAFLERCHEQFLEDGSGEVADYIPELNKADPAHFGISLATIDGHVYDVGDTTVQFTIQSISKAFVFALALETLGLEHVGSVISVEPSGEAFNSIRLTADNRPFNPMVNAGAIACSGLIHYTEGDRAFDRIYDALSRFAGRRLDIDDAVFHSERSTGDRNRAIAWLLHNYGILKGNVDQALDVYFRQCSILVNSHDLAVMAATLANGGVNPITGERVISANVVARTLSVMTSSGMYDYAGEWIYRVGIPAKSGVGGGIIAALPAQFGFGTFSPRLDSHGNSARGLKTCEALSSYFGLHLLNRVDAVSTCIIADYASNGLSSRRNRLPSELQILEQKGEEIRVIELVGALSFATADYVCRRLVDHSPKPKILILDFRRVPSVTMAAGLHFSDIFTQLIDAEVTVIFSGFEKTSTLWNSISAWAGSLPGLKHFKRLEDAIEWSEDQVIYRYGGLDHQGSNVQLKEQALFADLSPEDLAKIADLASERKFGAGEQIIAAGDPASSIFFLQSGMVGIKLRSGARLTTLTPGMAFGEMALLESNRSADVFADTTVSCLELPISDYEAFRKTSPAAGELIMRNLAKLLSGRLMLANAKVDVLSSH